MSYCRWSTDDFQCDLYVYESVSGYWSTSVAARRHVFASELPPKVEDYTSRAWVERHFEVMSMLETATLVPIGLPYDGMCFDDPDAESCADRCQMLRDAGYRFPDSVIEDLRAEAAELAAAELGTE